MFVKYDCGCIGFVACDTHWCVKQCDGDGEFNPIGIWDRKDLEGQPYDVLELEELSDLFHNIDLMLKDGDKYRKIKKLLG